MGGAWCFVDQYGPEDVSLSGGMRVPPHPHTGLQTVSWLVEGDVEVEIFNADLWAAPPATVVEAMADRYLQLVEPYLT
jgi:redox-sensitive bicupin YhaK (pirin superfamily)